MFLFFRMRMTVFENSQTIQRLVREAVAKRDLPHLPCRLVAVSKTKPVSDIVEAYNAGIRHFGENYIQELHEKSNDSTIIEKCPDIKWHYVGHLQSNKSKLLSKVKNLFLMETIDSTKLCDKLNSESMLPESGSRLKVLVQVNSSGETQKSGTTSNEAVSLVDHIVSKCPNLEFRGLMTIGSYGHDYTQGENPDFEVLLSCKERLLDHMGLKEADLEMSFGMSNDYLHAISMGSTNVRVGSSIFGSRQYPTS